MTEFRITVKNIKTATTLRKVLSEIPDLEIVENSGTFRENFHAGNFSPNEKVSDVEGAWKNGRVRDANKIREEAWTRKN
jgi:hypothetical protein